MNAPQTLLGDICEFKYGKSLPAAIRDGGGSHVYGSNGLVGQHSETITNGPTIVVGRKGSIGEINFSQNSCWPIDTTYYIDKSCTKADLKWLFYALSSLRLTELNKAAAIPGLNRNDAYAKRLPSPPLPEQRRIAAILDKAEALRTKRREAIAKLDQLLQSVFLEIFGDPASNPKKWPVGKISEMLDGLHYGSSSKADISGEVPILRMGNLTYEGEIDLQDLKYISKSDAPDKYLVHPGEILFNRTNSKDLVGKTAVYGGPTPMAYAGYLVKGIPKSNHRAEYISSFMNSKYGKILLKSMCKSIVGMANINAKEFGSISIPIPPTELQDKFRQIVNEIQNKKYALKKQAKKLEDLSHSLQQRFFNA